MKSGKESESFEALCARLEAQMSPEERAAIASTLDFLARSLEDTKKYEQSLLRRLGVRTDLDDPEEFHLRLWAAARHMGLSTEEFWSLAPREFCALLELKVREFELREGAPEPRRDTSGPGDLPPQNEPPPRLDGNGEIIRRQQLLADYRLATGNPSNKKIYEARNSGIHKPQFYGWLKGELPATSQTAINFERFLSEKKPPIPRKPKV